MSKEKQIEEMARIICRNNRDCRDCGHNSAVRECGCLFYAKRLYEQGYRKKKKGENVSGAPSLYECSVCHWRDNDTCTADTSEYNFCPNCGARMKGV